jgi:RNA polymerase sigma-70 factor (ECF subfamily)
MERLAEQIEELYRERFGAFRAMAAAITGGWDTAVDAVQEGFARAYARRSTYRGDGSVEAWVWRIVLRTATEQRRARGAVSGEWFEAQLPDDPESNPELADALRRLSPKRRLVVFLRYFADLSYREIADVMGTSEGTVAATLSQAHAELARMLDIPKVTP